MNLKNLSKDPLATKLFYNLWILNSVSVTSIIKRELVFHVALRRGPRVASQYAIKGSAAAAMLRVAGAR